jgi:hypothetical protein
MVGVSEILVTLENMARSAILNWGKRCGLPGMCVDECLPSFHLQYVASYLRATNVAVQVKDCFVHDGFQ